MKLFDVYPVYEIEPVRGLGNYVYDAGGKQYLDFYGGHAVISIGHSHPHYIRTVGDQLQKLAFYSNSILNPLQVELAQKLGDLSGCGAYELFLCNSGAEANENALKLASFHTGRSKMIAFKKAFHGRTSAAVNTTDNDKIKAPVNRTFPVEFHELNNMDTVQASLQLGDVAAVIVEGIQGVGGIFQPGVEFLQQLQALCEEHNAILILDEIQSGYGRSGNFFAFQYAGIQPDIITVAKGMGNGFPVGGVLIGSKFEARHGLLGTTFGGNHLACAASIAVLDVIKEEGLVENAQRVGEQLKQALAGFSDILEIRGRGLMLGLQFNYPVADLRKRLLFSENIFTGSASDANTIRLLPSLTVGDKEVDRLLEGFKNQLA